MTIRQHRGMIEATRLIVENGGAIAILSDANTEFIRVVLEVSGE